MITLLIGVCLGIAADRIYPVPVGYAIEVVKGWFKKASDSVKKASEE